MSRVEAASDGMPCAADDNASCDPGILAHRIRDGKKNAIYRQMKKSAIFNSTP